MKAKFYIASLCVLGASVVSFAQGYKDGIDFYNIGDYENAKVIFDRNPANNQPEYNYYQGAVALKTGDVKAAQSYFDKGIAADPTYPYNFVGKAAIALKNGNKSEGEELIKAARKLSKKDSKLEIAIARAYYDADPTANAKSIQKCMKDARKWNAKSPDLCNFEGDTYADQEQWGDAAAQYEWAMTYDPGNVEATVKYANTYFRVAPDLAIEKLRGIIATNPNSALAQRQLAEKLYERAQFVEAAQRYGSYITSTNNHFPKDEARYALLLFDANKFDESLAISQQLKNSVDRSNVYSVIGSRLIMYNLIALERWDEAVNEGDELFSLSTNPDRYNATDYVKYATALDKKGMAAQAMAAYSKAIELDPSNLKLMRNLVDQAIKAKEYDKAAAYGEKLIESPEHTNSDYNRVADIYIAQYEDSTTTADVKAMAYDKSLKYLKKVLEVDPDNIIATYNQSYLEKISETENNGKALNSMQNLIRAINKSEDISPYKPTLRYAYRYIAQYYYNKKDYRNAIDNFRKLKQYDPTNTRIDDVIEQLEKHIK